MQNRLMLMMMINVVVIDDDGADFRVSSLQAWCA